MKVKWLEMVMALTESIFQRSESTLLEQNTFELILHETVKYNDAKMASSFIAFHFRLIDFEISPVLPHSTHFRTLVRLISKSIHFSPWCRDLNCNFGFFLVA